jgi:hypothetical protein
MGFGAWQKKLSVRFVESQLYEIKGIGTGIPLTAIFALTAATLHRRHDSRAAPSPPIPPARYELSNSATLAPLQRTGGSRRRLLGSDRLTAAAQSARVRDKGEFQQDPSDPPSGKTGLRLAVRLRTRFGKTGHRLGFRRRQDPATPCRSGIFHR